MLTLDHVTTEPSKRLAYVKVADDITAKIISGELAPGARLRSERDLADEYQVAVDTIRRAAGLLRERGLIETVQGSGTYVTER
jgi:DNA-binding GntR family transcriptional regulator